MLATDSVPTWLPDCILEDVTARSLGAEVLNRRRKNYYDLLQATPTWDEQTVEDLGFNIHAESLLWFETPDGRRYFPRFQFMFAPQGGREQWPVVSRISQEWLAARISPDLLLTWWFGPDGEGCNPALNLGILPDDELYALAAAALRSL